MKPFFLFCLFFLGGGFLLFAKPSGHKKYETRAVWLTTISNIDWPTERLFTSARKKKELLEYLDYFQSLKINTIYFQARAMADAFYDSPLEPWSFYLTGQKGVSPSPFFDPLHFLVKEAHKRNIDVHAWLNPYRAETSSKRAKDTLTMSHLKPEWIVKYGKQYYLNPGVEEARKHVVKVVVDITKRYDLDGIHFDDYFYPYPLADTKFNDDKVYNNDTSVEMSKYDWRRHKITLLIKEVSDTLKKIKPYVKFGVSPFAVWRNKRRDSLGSETETFSSYDGLYADVRLWVKNNWIDYIVPQLYWKRSFSKAPLKTLVSWWGECVDSTSVELVFGVGVFNYYSKSQSLYFDDPYEIHKQLLEMKKHPNVEGYSFFSAKPLKKNPNGLSKFLRRQFFRYPAIPPPPKRISQNTFTLNNSIKRKKDSIFFENPIGKNIKYHIAYVVDTINKKHLNTIDSLKTFFIPEKIYLVTKKEGFFIDREHHLLKDKKEVYLFISHIDRFNRELFFTEKPLKVKF